MPTTSLRLPNALIVGAPKCGTTTLCDALSRHPGVFMYPRKEIHFFNHHFDRGLDWYGSLFRDAPAESLVMEGTPDYAMSNHVEAVAPRLARHLPKARLIYMIRDPVERVESHYVQMLANGRPAIGIGRAVEEWPEIVETSRYLPILRRLAEVVGRDRILVLRLDRYAADPDGTHAAALRFLGLGADAENLARMRPEGTTRSHPRENQARDGRILAALRRSRFYDAANRRLPAPVIRLGKRLGRRPIETEIAWPPGLRARVERSLVEDWHRLLAELDEGGAAKAG